MSYLPLLAQITSQTKAFRPLLHRQFLRVIVIPLGSFRFQTLQTSSHLIMPRLKTRKNLLSLKYTTQINCIQFTRHNLNYIQLSRRNSFLNAIRDFSPAQIYLLFPRTLHSSSYACAPPLS